MLFDSAGNLYITTSRGVRGGAGVFKLTPTVGGNYQGSIAYSSSGLGLPQPFQGLTFDSAGNLYSASSTGGGACGCGFVYELTPNGSNWNSKVLLDMNGTSGNYPVGGVAFDAAGNIYVATQFGGAHRDGVVIEITP
jgi:hypothetical protein